MNHTRSTRNEIQQDNDSPETGQVTKKYHVKKIQSIALKALALHFLPLHFGISFKIPPFSKKALETC